VSQPNDPSYRDSSQQRNEQKPFRDRQTEQRHHNNPNREPTTPTTGTLWIVISARVDKSPHCFFIGRLPHGFLVELTGIEPVASWLQTRRSPS
jgi:hypothetical protein